jgi:hypothetical protein
MIEGTIFCVLSLTHQKAWDKPRIDGLRVSGHKKYEPTTVSSTIDIFFGGGFFPPVEGFIPPPVGFPLYYSPPGSMGKSLPHEHQEYNYGPSAAAALRRPLPPPSSQIAAAVAKVAVCLLPPPPSPPLPPSTHRHRRTPLPLLSLPIAAAATIVVGRPLLACQPCLWRTISSPLVVLQCVLLMEQGPMMFLIRVRGGKPTVERVMLGPSVRPGRQINKSSRHCSSPVSA